MKQGVLKGSNYISDVFDFKDSVEAIEYFKAKEKIKEKLPFVSKICLSDDESTGCFRCYLLFA